MKIELEKNRLEEIDCDALVIPVFKAETVQEGFLQKLDQLTNGVVGSAIEVGEIKGKLSEVAYIHLQQTVKASRLILVGVGSKKDLSANTLGQVAATAARFAAKKKISRLSLIARCEDWPESLEKSSAICSIVESVLTGIYDLEKYKNKKEDIFNLKTFSIALDGQIDEASATKSIERATITAEATNFTRDLCVEPGSTLTPKEFAKRVAEMSASVGLTYEVLDEEQMQELGMGALLAVSRGSDEPAQLMVLRHNGKGGNNPVALVGKGITFDSGGLCIKPREGMWEMKMDMSGGATVAGTMLAIAKLKPEIDVIGIIPASENLPSGKSYKPGDVLKASSGKTIEVIDTDAEGRLILADAIHYAVGQNPACIIDLATLTGACVVALGTLRAALMGSDQQLIDEIEAASLKAGEKLWQMPLDDEYSEMIKSDIADIKNLGSKGAGSITAGAFLKEFVADKPWAHLDIAGTAWLEENKPYMAKGPTGYGVKTLVEFLLSRASQN
ncbi:MAG: leucyl aminopeptidase [Blastocatellia bacterium]|nr:leucyl aminopeptidase [Blastocatellia bacterium]